MGMARLAVSYLIGLLVCIDQTLASSACPWAAAWRTWKRTRLGDQGPARGAAQASGLARDRVLGLPHNSNSSAPDFRGAAAKGAGTSSELLPAGRTAPPRSLGPGRRWQGAPMPRLRH